MYIKIIHFRILLSPNCILHCVLPVIEETDEEEEEEEWEDGAQGHLKDMHSRSCKSHPHQQKNVNVCSHSSLSLPAAYDSHEGDASVSLCHWA